jgi:hypothetical protein
MKTKKKVTFYHTTYMYIISPIKELTTLHLWWTDYDRLAAIETANKEIFRLRKMHPEMSVKDANKLLYQPNNISYDPSNFLYL